MEATETLALQRTVRETAALDGVHAFRVKSLSHKNGPEWHPVVDVVTGSYRCDCPDWIHRKEKRNRPCKHIEKALRQLRRRGLLPRTRRPRRWEEA